MLWPPRRPLYQLYVDHYRRLEVGFANVRHIYRVPTLADAGIPMMDRTEFEEHFQSLNAERAGKWLARMLRRQNHRWGEIEPALYRLRSEVGRCHQALISGNGGSRIVKRGGIRGLTSPARLLRKCPDDFPGRSTERTAKSRL